MYTVTLTIDKICSTNQFPHNNGRTNKKNLFYATRKNAFKSAKIDILLVLDNFNPNLKPERYYQSKIDNQSLREE